ncbi:hypothetical protein B0H14DRAFT_2816723 [Mycena olivaceomarginata]|nr:hypothetical protein B0H14DRAFT_2816723 [Mycena olivaceomarginata]
MSSASASPMLPLELEREIFEIYALSWPKLIPKLMLVAKCVKEWVEPLLYRIISIDVFPIAGLPWVAVDIMSRRYPSEASNVLPRRCAPFDALPLRCLRDDLISMQAAWKIYVCPKLSVVEDAWIPLIERLPLRRLCAYYNLFAVLSPANCIFSRLPVL